MYYSYRKVDSYNVPVKIILSRRGLGKTFNAIKNKGVYKYLTKCKRFIYVVETQEMVKTLTMNKGEKFFSSLIEVTKNNPSCKNNKIFNALVGSSLDDFISEDDSKKMFKSQSYTIGGTIKINNDTAGYIISYNDYGNLKRNNFVNIGTIIIDEFIPEERDIRNLKDPYRMTSIVQSVARLQDIEIIMLANTIRLDDPVLETLGLQGMKPGEIKKIYVDGELFGVCHFVDNSEYKDFDEVSKKSVATKFAKMMKQTQLDDNNFTNKVDDNLLIPTKLLPNHLLCCIHGDNDISVRIHATQSYKLYYVLADYGNNTRKRYCVDKKNISPVVTYNPQWGETLKHLYQANKLKFENNTVYFYFKNILKIN